MPILKNIRKEHVLDAIRYIDEHGVPLKRESTKYDLSFNDKLYPPKYVLSFLQMEKSKMFLSLAAEMKRIAC